jgi:glycosyltransferase involved in cell wall biosynthesis
MSMAVDEGTRKVPASAPDSLVLVGPLPPPHGGMANQTRQLSRLLEEDGCRVIVVQTNRPYWPRWVEHVRVVRAVFRLLPYLHALWHAVGKARIVHVMANSGWAWHLFAAPAVWIASLRGRPVVVNYRGGGAEEFFSSQWWIVRRTLRRVTGVLVPSRFLERVFSSRGIASEVVPNIIDLDRFRPGPRDADGLNLVVARNLEDIYDIPTAIRAFAVIRVRYPHARLTVVGSGPALAALKHMVDKLDLQEAVIFTGRVDNVRMAMVYRQAHVALNPSRVDNMPISLLEAMASGVPIVSTNAGGIPDMIDDGKTGLLVPTGDAHAMAAAALRVLNDPELAGALREAGLEAAERYTWRRTCPGLYASYANASARVRDRQRDARKIETRSAH